MKPAVNQKWQGNYELRISELEEKFKEHDERLASIIKEKDDTIKRHTRMAQDYANERNEYSKKLSVSEHRVRELSESVSQMKYAAVYAAKTIDSLSQAVRS